MGPGGIPIAPASPTARDYQNTLMHCVLSGARSFEVLLAFADFGGSVDTGKSSACMPVLWDGQRDAISRMSRTVLLMSVYKDRWRSDDNASLRRHPIYIARTVQVSLIHGCEAHLAELAHPIPFHHQRPSIPPPTAHAPSFPVELDG